MVLARTRSRRLCSCGRLDGRRFRRVSTGRPTLRESSWLVTLPLILLSTVQGYSWGCISALLAPNPQATLYRISSIMLVSPPLSFLPAVTYFSGSFDKILSAILSKSDQGGSTSVWAVFGDADNFTGIKTFRAWTERHGRQGLLAREVQGDHFWRDGASGRSLRLWLSQWLR